MVRLIFVWEGGHTYGVEEARIPLLSSWHAIDRIGNLVVVVIKHWQAVTRLEGIDEVLRGFMEIPATRPDTPAAIEHVAPIGTSVERVVILIVGVLYSKDTLFGILVLRQEDITKIFQVAIL